MELRFNLRESLNELLAQLDNIDKRNLVKLGVDIKVPSIYKGSSEPLIKQIRKLCIFLSEYLVNGIVEIELTAASIKGVHVNLLTSVSGIGNHKSGEKLNKEIDRLVTESKHLLKYTVLSNEIKFSFTYATEQEEQVLESVKKCPLESKKILLAEDNEINAMVFTSFLDEWGCKHSTAINGEEAIHVAHDNEFDVILMDIFMPVKNGIEATKSIREFNTTIPIIALTASTRDEDIREVLAVGANDYLLKPVSSAQLYQVLSKYL